MKKLKMIVTSVVVLAIVGSAFAFNAKKIGSFCVSSSTTSNTCNIVLSPSHRVSGTPTLNYVVDWDGTVCDGTGICITAAKLAHD